MRNLRLYNTDAAFKSHEQAAGGDGNKTVTVVPGISMSKDQRKRYFNPHDNSILVYNVTVNCLKQGTQNQYAATKVKAIRVVSGTTTDVYFNSPIVRSWKPAVPTGVFHYPTDTAVTIPYVSDMYIRCTYMVSSTTQTTKIFNVKPTPNLSAISINDEIFPATAITETGYTFGKIGKNVVTFHFSTWPISMNYCITPSGFTNVTSMTEIEINYLDYHDDRGYDIYGEDTDIPAYFLDGCINLEKFTVNGSKNISTNSGTYAFRNCQKLKTICQDGQKVYAAGTGVFYGCSALESITIVDGSSLGASAFCNCTSLRVINGKLPRNPIGYVFYGCHSLRTIELPEFEIKYRDYEYPDAQGYELKTANLTGFSSIGDYCFYQCSSLTIDTIPMVPYVTSAASSSTNGTLPIGTGAFGYCFNLSNVTITLEKLRRAGTYGGGVLAYTETQLNINDYVFNFCSGMTSISVPENTIYLGNNCFSNCKKLSNITLPNTLTGIGSSCFAYCNNLTDLSFWPSNLSGIPNSCFSYSRFTGETVENPTTVSHVGMGAFYECTINKLVFNAPAVPVMKDSLNENAPFQRCQARHLVFNDLPTLNSSYNDGCFANMSNLETITITYTPQSTPDCYYNAFYGVRRNGKLYYPQGAQSKFSSWLMNSSYLLGYYGWTGEEITN